MQRDALHDMIFKRNIGIHCGIPSYCTASGIVIEAALQQGKRFGDDVLIEGTSNQVNQFGGYTGMRPADYKEFVLGLADKVNFPRERVILGGDHLGPLVWCKEPEESAMAKARDLVREYVLAGYKKIHLDTSMRLGDDSTTEPLATRTIARRGAELFKVCEEAYQELLKQNPDEQRPAYVIGSEVPIPGGEQEIYSLDELKDIFRISGISKSPAIFDIEKLRYFNAAYIRAMEPAAFAAVAEPYIRQAVKNPAYDAGEIAALLQQRTEILTEIPEKLDFFDELPEYDTALFTHKKSKSDAVSSAEVLQQVLPLFEGMEAWTEENILAVLGELTERMGVKTAKVMWPVRIAAAGKAVTPGGAVEICHILGRDETLRRIRIALEKLANA